jgi:hypothetical protein
MAAYPYPQITFKVNTVDYVQLAGRMLPDQDRQNVIDQLASATVWVQYWPWPLKNGDTFTLYGREAVQVYQTKEQINTIATFEVIYYGNPILPPELTPNINFDYQTNFAVQTLSPETNGFNFFNTFGKSITPKLLFTMTDSSPQSVYVQVTNNGLVEIMVTINGLPNMVLPNSTFSNTTVLTEGQNVQISANSSADYTQGMIFGIISIVA